MAEEKRALGYICPECGKSVYGERTAFALSAAAVGLVCDCGRSELKAESDGQVFRVTVPCGVMRRRAPGGGACFPGDGGRGRGPCLPCYPAAVLLHR